jgi:hypothetical protein
VAATGPGSHPLRGNFHVLHGETKRSNSLPAVLRAAIVGSIPLTPQPNKRGADGQTWDSERVRQRQAQLREPYEELRQLIDTLRAEPELYDHVISLLSGWRGSGTALIDTARMLAVA